MNHDATHCLDYDKEKCPKSCYRAELTEELNERKDLWGMPLSYSHLLETDECPRYSKKKDGRLALCPLCGGDGAMKNIPNPFRHGWVGCPKCSLYMQWSHDPKATIERWNKRCEIS